MAHEKRRQKFIDRHVQGGLVLRAVMYWCFCLLTLSLFTMCWTILTGERRTGPQLAEHLWTTYAPAVIGSLLLLPIVAMDAVKFSNRFAGPIYRLRNALKAAAAGDPVRPIQFRDGDFWHDLAESFNAALVPDRSAERAHPAPAAPAETAEVR